MYHTPHLLLLSASTGLMPNMMCASRYKQPKPNARPQPHPQAGAERTLEGVGCRPLLGTESGTGHRLRSVARSLIRWCGVSPPRLQAETEEVLTHHLDVRRRHDSVLGGDVHVAEAAFEAAARVTRRRPGGIEHQVHGLGRALGRVSAR